MLYHIPQAPAFAAFDISLFSRSYLCVDLFFVLSGFVISIGYYDKVARHLGAASYRDFLINRLARVFPLHLIVALVFAARMLVNVSGDGHSSFTGMNLLANVLMVQSWGLGTAAFAGNSWSVSTELMAYLLFPLIAILAFSRLFWLEVIAALLLLYLVATSGIGVEGPMDVVSRDSVLPLLRCLAGFALGVIAYRFALLPQTRRVFDRDAAFIVVCALIAGAFLIPRGDLLVVLMCPFLVLACYYDSPVARAVMANRLSYHLGLISYSIYLWHPLFRDVAARLTGMLHARGVTQHDGLIVVALILVTWFACWLSYLWIEVYGHRLVKAIDRRIRQRRFALGAAE